MRRTILSVLWDSFRAFFDRFAHFFWFISRTIYAFWYKCVDRFGDKKNFPLGGVWGGAFRSRDFTHKGPKGGGRGGGGGGGGGVSLVFPRRGNLRWITFEGWPFLSLSVPIIVDVHNLSLINARNPHIFIRWSVQIQIFDPQEILFKPIFKLCFSQLFELN